MAVNHKLVQKNDTVSSKSKTVFPKEEKIHYFCFYWHFFCGLEVFPTIVALKICWILQDHGYSDTNTVFMHFCCLQVFCTYKLVFWSCM